MTQKTRFFSNCWTKWKNISQQPVFQFFLFPSALKETSKLLKDSSTKATGHFRRKTQVMLAPACLALCQRDRNPERHPQSLRGVLALHPYLMHLGITQAVGLRLCWSVSSWAPCGPTLHFSLSPWSPRLSERGSPALSEWGLTFPGMLTHHLRNTTFFPGHVAVCQLLIVH